eukprot:gb/GECH01011728.1/.p1 GENE.gb/GECH01011728.1/~~gb/GECH01011728.1/.p1  ORF type:complete len:345 (+),score=49.20 gb/GECH01011728.1/:1-1035(+)
MLTQEKSPPDKANDDFPGFEGPEKKVEMEFRIPSNVNPNGLRQIEKDKLQYMLDFASCTILSKTGNEYFDSYVLSESSLFVYPNKAIIKTCGTTTLLKCIPILLEYGKSLGLELDFVYFSRKNLLFPRKQDFPHQNFQNELEYLEQFFSEGCGYVMGPLNKDRWHLYLADYGEERNLEQMPPDQTLEICMHDLHPEAMKPYFKDSHADDTQSVATVSGIRNLLPGSIIDEFMFEPCGYSMNGLLGEHYWTIHITPEDECSYVSFETNVPSSETDYDALIQRVTKLFRPGRFTLSLFADDHAFSGQKTHNAFDTQVGGFKLQNKTFYEFEGEYNITVCNYKNKNQ